MILFLSLIVPFQVPGQEEEEIALADVPQVVLEAAYKAQSGIELTEAEKSLIIRRYFMNLKVLLIRKNEILVSQKDEIIS